MLQNQWHIFCCQFYCSLTLYKFSFISLVTHYIFFLFFDVAVAARLSSQKVPSNPIQVHQSVRLLSKIQLLCFLILLTLLTLLNRYIAQ